MSTLADAKIAYYKEMGLMGNTISDFELAFFSRPRSGATADRPTGVAPGVVWFDTTLGKPIWYDGTKWILADGTAA